MSYTEFAQWQEFFVVEPPLAERVDLAGALVATMLANIHRAQGAEPAKLSEFLLVEQALREKIQTERPPSKAEQEAAEAAIAKRQLETFILQMGGVV